jgi:oligoendopeptidase F
MNAAGMDSDVRTLLHEAGHAFHAIESRNDPQLAYRSAPIEFCEVASMSMELVAMDFLTEFYPNPADHARAKRKQLESLVGLLPWIACVDAFQHWIYTHPNHTHDQRNDQWLTITDRLTVRTDWTGHETAHKLSWHRQRHLWSVPLYYVEYGIAQLGALQLWANYLKDPKAAITAYRRALALGGSRPLPELFASAGIRFDFSPSVIAPVMKLVGEELDRLPE